MITFQLENPEGPEAPQTLRKLFLAVLSTQTDAGVPIPNDPRPDTIADMWQKGLLMVHSARDSEFGNNIVSLVASMASVTLFGEKLQITAARYTQENYRQKGINKQLNEYVDETFRKAGVKLALSVVVKDTPGHKQMEKLGAKYPYLQGYREL